MITWSLIFFMSVGGPSEIGGYQTEASCEKHLRNIKRIKNVQFGFCNSKFTSIKEN